MLLVRSLLNNCRVILYITIITKRIYYVKYTNMLSIKDNLYPYETPDTQISTLRYFLADDGWVTQGATVLTGMTLS